MRLFILLLLVNVGFVVYAQSNTTCESFVDILETDIVFNEYLTDVVKIEKVNTVLKEVSSKDFKQKDIFTKYAQVNLAFSKDDNDQALYKFIELTEICDISNPIELRIYLGSLLQISSVFRENNAIELSLKYIEKGIEIIEKKELEDYPWIQDFYNDAGVDLLSLGEYEKSRVALKTALTYKNEGDHLQDAMVEFNLSFLYFELNNLDSAIFHQSNTCSYFAQIEDLPSYPEVYNRYANSLGSLAIFYYFNGDFAQAQKIASQAKTVFEEIEIYDSGRYPYLYTLINLNIDNNTDQINYLFDEIELVASKIEEGRYNFYQLLSDSYKRMGNSKREVEYLNLAYHQFQEENSSTISKLEQYNSKLQAQILQAEKNRFQTEKNALKRKALLRTSIISLVFVFFISILYLQYTRTKNKSNILEKEKEIARIEFEKNEIKSKLTENELNEKRLVTKRLASHIKLKQQTENAFLQKIKDLKGKKPQNIEAEISELHVKMVNLINIDQNFEQNLQVNDLNQEFRGKLRKAHPELSEKELQFCTYLLLDLTAKEIGSITNQSSGAIRVYKNRIKKKLLGNQEKNLISYLHEI